MTVAEDVVVQNYFVWSKLIRTIKYQFLKHKMSPIRVTATEDVIGTDFIFVL